MKTNATSVLIGVILNTVISLPASARQAQANPERNAYFGELHIHSSYALDAYAFGTKDLGPEAATRYAMGRAVTHPGGFAVQLEHPLDFTLVMDHSEYTGVFPMAEDPDSSFRKNDRLLASTMRFGLWTDAMGLYKVLSVTLLKDKPIKELQGPDVAGHAWKQIVAIADEYNDPGTFTTFPGWEWTATPAYKNLHRIVFFKDSKHASAAEFSSLDSSDPRDLWKWMTAQRAAGNDVIAITHNGNLSDGALYPRRITHAGQPIDREYAETRMRNEPVAEITQVKGQSETTPRLSPEDEFADFNVFVWLLLGAKGVPTDYGSYIRLALRDGIAMQGAFGFNPYKFGMTAGSDSHSAASAYRHDDYFGEHGTMDASIEDRLSSEKHLNMDNRQVCPAGLTGVWAEENTREALWAAFFRKETYATSGLRMKVRLFGGWEYDPAVMDGDDWVKTAYAKGVPMGGDLTAATSDAPRFLVWAESDPTGADLDRIQIVKGWARNGQSFERIYDVAWSGDRTPDPTTGKVPPVRNTVDISKGTYENTTGSRQLKAVWTDPDFDPTVDAFYYARTLLIPTPRWTTIQSAKLGVVPPHGVPLTVQDRAWSSPIWYTPDPEARKRAKPGVTVADLEEQGAVALTDEQLKAKIVGNTIKVHNTVTGREVEILYGVNGQRMITAVDGEAPTPGEMGDLVFDPQTAYTIRDGRVTTYLDGTPFEVSVYDLNGKYLACRSDEYGYVNYELE